MRRLGPPARKIAFSCSLPCRAEQEAISRKEVTKGSPRGQRRRRKADSGPRSLTWTISLDSSTSNSPKTNDFIKGVQCHSSMQRVSNERKEEDVVVLHTVQRPTSCPSPSSKTPTSSPPSPPPSPQTPSPTKAGIKGGTNAARRSAAGRGLVP